MTAAIQTLWAELLVGSLGDAGVTICVISPGSRSTPIALALASDGRFDLPAIIDERAAAFYALGAARATGAPVAMVCTSGTAAAHYLPAIIEASLAGVPLVAITADRPPELQHCGATQTIDQIEIFGGYTRAAFDLGAPVGSELALRALRRTVLQAITLARGPHPGPVHLEVPLRKPLEPAAPSTAEEHALARVARELRGSITLAPAPRLVADPAGIAALADAIAEEPCGLILAGAMPVTFRHEAVLALAAHTGYPLLAESGSQLRFTSRPGVTAIDHYDLLLASELRSLPPPRLIIQLGAEPVAAVLAAMRASGAARHLRVEHWVLADHTWRDPDSSARGVIIGDIAATCEAVLDGLASARRLRATSQTTSFVDEWRSADQGAAAAIDRALIASPRSEDAILRAAVEAAPTGTILQIGNSLPIRVIDQVCAGGASHPVITQRGAAGIDGLVASAAGATASGTPVLLVLGDVSFAHDLGGLLAARAARAPLAIVVIDNGGGRIFGDLPAARVTPAATFDRYFVVDPAIDPSAIATALGIRAVTAASPAAIGGAVATALATPGPTVIHAPVSATGARDVRDAALELLVPQPLAAGAHHG